MQFTYNASKNTVILTKCMYADGVDGINVWGSHPLLMPSFLTWHINPHHQFTSSSWANNLLLFVVISGPISRNIKTIFQFTIAVFANGPGLTNIGWAQKRFEGRKETQNDRVIMAIVWILQEISSEGGRWKLLMKWFYYSAKLQSSELLSLIKF